MADCLAYERRKIRCCLGCRSIDSVHFFRFPKDYRRQLWCDYCERYKAGFKLKDYYRLCSVCIMLYVMSAGRVRVGDRARVRVSSAIRPRKNIVYAILRFILIYKARC